MENYVINIEHLQKSFGNKSVLVDVNLKIKKGETVATLGKSGSGKSVTFQCIAGLLLPDGGLVEVLGKNVAEISYEELTNLRKRIGFLFQSGALYDSMSVKENLAFPLIRQNRKISQDEIDTKVEQRLKDVNLLDAIDKMPSELSGGMRKRLGLARTLILEPEVMLYDEPTTGLDPVTTREISFLIKSIKEKYNMTSLIVTHDMICTKIVADRVVFLNDGKYIAEGTYDEMKCSDNEFIKSFFDITENE